MSFQRVQKEGDELLYTVWSLVMVRAFSQLKSTLFSTRLTFSYFKKKKANINISFLFHAFLRTIGRLL